VVAVTPFMLKTVVRYTTRFVKEPTVPSFSKVSFPAHIHAYKCHIDYHEEITYGHGQILTSKKANFFCLWKEKSDKNKLCELTNDKGHGFNSSVFNHWLVIWGGSLLPSILHGGLEWRGSLFVFIPHLTRMIFVTLSSLCYEDRIRDESLLLYETCCL